MEIGRLILGAALILVFGWFLVKNIRRYGVAKGMYSFDIVLGLVAGFYLVITSVW